MPGGLGTWLFWLGLGFVGFTYAGYPVLIALLAQLRLRARGAIRGLPAERAEWPMVTVVVAGHDAAAAWPAKLETLAALDWPRERLELVAVDDGSSDDSRALLAAAAETEVWRGRLRVVAQERRSGKPSALNAAVALARGEVLLMNDVRQRLNPGALRALVAALKDPAVGVVGGELRLEGEGGAGAYWLYEAWIRKQEGRYDSTLGVSGALYVMRRELWQDIPADTVLDDMLIPLRVRLGGKRILFEPDAQAFDRTADTQREFGRKARTLAGNYQLFARTPRLLLPGLSPLWWQLWCHKVFRLLVPWALLTVLGTNIWLVAHGSVLYRAPLVAQGAAYLGALAGAVRERGGGKGGGLVGMLLGLCWTFVSLNAAAVVGLWRWLTGAQRITW